MPDRVFIEVIPKSRKTFFTLEKIEAPAPISGPFFQSGKVKNLKFSDIGAGAIMRDSTV